MVVVGDMLPHTKYDFGQVKPWEFVHSIPVAAPSKLEGRDASVQISSLEGLFISSSPACCSVCYVSVPCRRRCQLQINQQGRVFFVRLLQHNIVIKRTAILSLSGCQDVDTRPVHLGVKNENIKTMALQARPCEPVGVSNALASDIGG